MTRKEAESAFNLGYKHGTWYEWRPECVAKECESIYKTGVSLGRASVNERRMLHERLKNQKDEERRFAVDHAMGGRSDAD